MTLLTALPHQCVLELPDEVLPWNAESISWTIVCVFLTWVLSFLNITLNSTCVSAQLCLPLCDPHGLYLARFLCPWNFPGKNTGIACYFLLQGIFPTQGMNLHLLCLLHWQADSNYWATWEAPLLTVFSTNFNHLLSPYMPSSYYLWTCQHINLGRSKMFTSSWGPRALFYFLKHKSISCCPNFFQQTLPII